MEADDWLLRAAAQRRRRLSVDVVHWKNSCFLIIVKKKVDVSHMTDDDQRHRYCSSFSFSLYSFLKRLDSFNFKEKIQTEQSVDNGDHRVFLLNYSVLKWEMQLR